MVQGLIVVVIAHREGARVHLTTALNVWENADEDFEPARRAREAMASL